MSDATPPKHRRKLAYHTATVRHAFLTRLPDALLRGSLRARHVTQPIEIAEHAFASAHWPRDFDGLRIAHISDIHFGHLLGEARLMQAIDAVRAVNADLIAITGDLVDLSAHEAPLLFERLALLKARLGVFVVLGNHDHLDQPRAIVRGARDAGLIPLVDDSVRAGGRDGLPSPASTGRRRSPPARNACGSAARGAQTCCSPTTRRRSWPPRSAASRSRSRATPMAARSHAAPIAATTSSSRSA